MGLTRGRSSNIAIVVTPTNATARECLVESMQRGTPELTMQDAVRAAQSETQRAARSRATALTSGTATLVPSTGREIGT